MFNEKVLYYKSSDRLLEEARTKARARLKNRNFLTVKVQTARTLCRKFLDKWIKGISLGPVEPKYPFDIDVIQPEVEIDD